ncbi:peptidase MA family metallohydrolase [Marinisporobacter balticus]|uniref:Peptidase MA superfamily protein n=1 Tax=Marinisporobacter balticus TaxID=2018667 RepID=A0A4R2L243_9FIRM|nr:peptidase MA family metallohydrolase [Marinisporobacter balticus]TCO77939.1 peptidase MA superfamily protein [Marinisporobacter balticus]
MKSLLNRKRSFALLIIVFIMLTGVTYYRTLKVHAYPLLAKMQHEWILYKTKDYPVKETEHFRIRYDIEDKEIIDLVAKASEQYYIEVCKMFDYYPKNKTTVIVYNNPDKLMENASLKQEKPPMGVYFASTIQILSPRLWITENEHIEDIFMNEGPMVHEFTHVLVDDLANGNYPLWLTEGIALYQEYMQTGYVWGEELSFEGNPYTVKELTKSFHELDQMLAYKRSFEIVKEMVETQGFDYINGLLSDLGEGKSIATDSKEVFEMDIQ